MRLAPGCELGEREVGVVLLRYKYAVLLCDSAQSAGVELPRSPRDAGVVTPAPEPQSPHQRPNAPPSRLRSALAQVVRTHTPRRNYSSAAPAGPAAAAARASAACVAKPRAASAHAATSIAAPTKKSIPGSGSGGASAVKAARTAAYSVEPMAPVSSVRAPSAPRSAPRSPGGAMLVRRAWRAGMQTQPTETTTMEARKPVGEGEAPAPPRPAAKTASP